jgi:hypothetical protein
VQEGCLRSRPGDWKEQQAVMRHKTQESANLKTQALLCLVSFVLLNLPLCATCYTLSVSHLPASRNGSTFLLITDLSGLGPDVEISFYGDMGREVPASPVRKLLPRNGKIQIDVEDYLLSTAGTIVLESSNEQIAGEYWQMQENGAMFMVPLQSAGEEARYFVNCSRFPPCGPSFLVFSDPYGSGPEVQMEFYSRTGDLEKIARKLLLPHGTLAFEVEYAPWGSLLGKASIRSFGGSIVLHYRHLYGNGEVIASPARLPGRDLLIDEFSTGRGITSNLMITDVSSEGPAIKIRFLNDSGMEIDSLEKLLPINGTVLIDPADYVGDDVSGVIKIGSGSEVIADYWEKNSQTILNIPALNAPAIDHEPGSVLFISHFSPLDNTQDLLSILNVGQERAEVEIQFYGNDGKRPARKGLRTLTLKPYEPFEELMGHYFDGARSGTAKIIVKNANARLVVTSDIFDLKNSRHLGRAYAQVIDR